MGIAVGKSVWVANAGDDTVSQIAAASGASIGSVTVGRDPEAIVATPGAVWVANRLDGTVMRIDEANGTVTQTTHVGDGPSGLVAADGAVWATNEFGASIARLDPATGAVREIPIGAAPVGAVVAGGELWTIAQATASTHRGGTLRVVGYSPDTVNPVLGYIPSDWQVASLLGDGLVGFQRASGLEGTGLVPDLATSLPAPTDGGRTYTFQVRRGIRYSNGQAVHPGDFRTAIERSFQGDHLGDALYTNLVGFSACAKQPATCDLSSGIVVDDAAGTVTFHLRAADPAFLYKLAMPSAFAIPQSTPARPGPEDPVPSTGPYMVSAVDLGTSLRLVRNPRFRVWSPAAQPQGLPDVIDFRFGASPEDEVRDVEHGTADVTTDGVPQSLLPEVSVHYSKQVHRYTLPATRYLWLDTRVPPFDNLLARRALNYATDRAHLVRLYGGDALNAPTCQVLPPQISGYRPYCPYTAHPSRSGAWTAPDMGRATTLVARSDTAGDRVALLASGAGPGGDPGAIRYFSSLLRRLGYRTTVTVYPNTSAGFQAWVRATGSGRFQAGVDNWWADYPSPTDFLPLLLGCGSVNNEAGYCDAHLQGLIDAAGAAETNDPPSAPSLWAKADRAAVDAAPWVAIVNFKGVDFVAARVGNYQRSPQFGILLDQIWVR